MSITINDYTDLQKYLSAFVSANSLTPAQAPHGVFWTNLTYQQFITDDVPGVPGYKIVVVGNADASNIVLALEGAKGTAFDPDTGTIGQMPQPSPPYNANVPTQTDIIAALRVWINAGCPNGAAPTVLKSGVCPVLPSDKSRSPGLAPDHAIHAATHSIVAGDWTYRTLINLVGPATQLSDLLLAEGQLHLEVNPEGTLVKSTLIFPGDTAPYRLEVQGGVVATAPGAPVSVAFTAYGHFGTNTAGWVYSYQGFLTPTWHYGDDHVVTLVGTAARTVVHGSGPAGHIGSFVAVKH